MTTYHPIVFWGQNKEYILLSVKVTNSKDVIVNITDENITFSAEGEGSNGLKNYQFDIKYYLPVISKDSSWKVKENFIEIKLKKELKESWVRLSYLSTKLPWLKCDFNNFFIDESDYGSDESTNNIKNIVNKSPAKRFDDEEMQKCDKFFSDIMKPLTLYIMIYNLFQFAGFIYVFGACIWIVYKHGIHDNLFLFPLIRDQLITIQLASILEIFHAYLGWVKSSPKSVFMQVFGRNMVLFLILLPHKELQSDKDIFTLLFSWSCIEIIRYPYYLIITMNENIPFLTWLRYTAWVPLYPIGFMSEGKLILRSIPLLQESKRFSFNLPNNWNVSFDFVTFLYVYLPLTILGFYSLMTRMLGQRRAKFDPALKHNWRQYSLLRFLVDALRPPRPGAPPRGVRLPLAEGHGDQ